MSFHLVHAAYQSQVDTLERKSVLRMEDVSQFAENVLLLMKSYIRSPVLHQGAVVAGDYHLSTRETEAGGLVSFIPGYTKS